MRAAMICAVALLMAACAKEEGPQGTEGTATSTGAERGACYGNGTCNDGLLCLSELCVRPPPADCAAVAKKVGNLTLSNYAPKAERAEAEIGLVTECKNLHLTKEQGDCILRSKTRSELRSCPKHLGMGRCDRLVAHLAKLAPSDQKFAQFLERGSDELLKQCEKQGLTAADERCVLAAKTFQELNACEPGRSR